MSDTGREAPVQSVSPSALLRSTLTSFFWPYFGAVFLQTGASVCAVLLPWALSQVIRTALALPHDTQNVTVAVLFPFVLFIGVVFAETILGRLRDAVQMRTRPRIRQYVVRRLFTYIQGHSHRYFSNALAGSLAHRVSDVAVGVAQTTWAVITEFWPAAVVLGVSIALLFKAHQGLGAFFLIWALMFVGIAYFLAAYAEPWGRRAAAARSETSGLIVDSLSNQQSVRLFAREQFERELLDRSQAHELNFILAANLYAERVRWFQFGFAALLKAGALWVSIYLWTRGEIGVAELVLAVSLSFLIINEVSNLSRRLTDFFESWAGVRHGLEVIGQPHEIVDTDVLAVAQISSGSIEFCSVGFAHEQGSNFINDLNLIIPAGEKVGLVGYSGAGKSTLVNLILRQYDPIRGAVLIGGKNIQEMSLDAVRSAVAYIPQEPSLFHRSLRENIRYGKLTASDEEVEAAAQMAGVHEHILSLPRGYDALVGERGVKLSGGQRQRVALARMFLKDAPILILDEATASLDAVTERTVLDTLDTHTTGKTVLVIAHRLSTIAHLDRILVMDTGAIVEDGSHGELISRRGLYWKLWTNQVDGFLPAVATESNYTQGKES